MLVLVPGDRADAADRRALRRALRRHRRRPALAAVAPASATTSGAAAPRRGARLRRAALGGVRADRGPRADRRRRGARRLLQARGRPALRRAPRRRAPRARRTAPCSSPAARRRGPRAVHALRAAAAARARRRRARCRRSRSSTCARRRGALHPRTHEALVDARKAIVLLNRRGWSNFLTCGRCGRAWECPHCDVTLVLHRARGRCRLPPLRPPRAVPVALPGLRLGLDRAPRHRHRAPRSTSSRGGPPGLPPRRRRAATPARGARARSRRAPRGILLGTQMVAKGHDFPDVDARRRRSTPTRRCASPTSAPRSARSRSSPSSPAAPGAAARGGRVLVQTLVPEAPAIALAARHDADGFLAGELERRAALRYPPFSTLIRDRLLVAREPGAADAAAGGGRARGCAGAGCWARRRCSACAAASAARSSSRREDRARGGRRGRRGGRRGRGRDASTAAVALQRRRRPAVAAPALGSTSMADEHPQDAERSRPSSSEAASPPLDPEVAARRARRARADRAVRRSGAAHRGARRSTASTTRCAPRSRAWAS